MVKIMSPAYPGQDLGVDTDSFAENEQSGAVAVGSILSGIDQLPKDPSFCTFWCAVALGALAKGSPIESVRQVSVEVHTSECRRWSSEAVVFFCHERYCSFRLTQSDRSANRKSSEIHCRFFIPSYLPLCCVLEGGELCRASGRGFGGKPL